MSWVDKLITRESPELDAAKAIIKAISIPDGRAHVKPMAEWKIYRGKRRFVVGYSWSRPASTYHGRVYDCILGYGDTAQEAIEQARKKLKLEL